MLSEDGSGSRSSRSSSVRGSMGHSRERYWHEESMVEGGPGGEGGYRELQPEKPKELGEVDSLNPYVEQAAHSLRQKSCAGYFPILGWLPFYSVSKLQGDLISGLSTGAMIIPQALAYSLLAGLPPTMGLYTGFFALVVYALLGQCGQLSIGPDAMTAMLIRSFLTSFSTDKDLDDLDPVVMANGLAILVGIFLTILGLFRFGFIDNILSKAVLRGFVTAVAFIIMIEQLPALLGIPVPKTIEFAYEKLEYLYEHIEETKYLNLGVGVASVAFLLFLSLLKGWFRWMVYIPGILILVVCGMAFAFFAKLPNEELPLLGTMPAGGFGLPNLPGVFSMSLHQTAHLIDAAVVISIVGFVESVVVAKEFSAKHHYQVSSNRELLALGASNIAASFFRSFPTFGSLPRSGVANATGAMTPLAGLFTALVLGICIQFLIPTFAYMPRVIMAAVIFRASLLLIEEHEIVYMFKVRAWNDATIMVIVGILTFLLGIEKGIIIGIGISIFMVVKRTTLPRLAVLLRTPTGKFKSKEESDQGKPVNGVLLVRLEEKYLYYANIGQTQALLTRQVEEALMDARDMQRGDESDSEPTLCVVINMKWVENMDVSSQLAMESLVEEFHARSIGLFLVRLNPDLRVRFERSGLVAKLGSDHLCLTNALAMQAAIDWRRQMEKNAHELPL